MSLVDLFSALADATRCRVVEMLHERSRPVHELAAAFDISRPAISRHLRVLKDAGLVVEEKTGRENVYSLQRGKLKPMQDWLEKHRTAKVAPKRASKAKPAEAPVAVEAAEVVAAPPVETVAEPVVEVIVAPPVVEPPIVIEPVVAEQIGVEAPKAPKRAKKPKPEPVAPPPSAAPQLSFFDL